MRVVSSGTGECLAGAGEVAPGEALRVGLLALQAIAGLTHSVRFTVLDGAPV